MFKNTGYFNPTGTRNITFSDYDSIDPYQRPDRFFLKYVRSYVPPPPLPPEPVVDNGGGDNNIIPGDSYNDIPGLTSGDNSQVDIGVGADYTTASDLGYSNDPGIEMGPGGGSGSNSPTSGGVSPDMADAMDHHSSGIHDGGNDHGGHDGHSGGGASDGSEADTGGGYGGLGHSDGGKIPPMYAQTGSFVDGVKQTDLDLGTAMALARDKAGSILGTITGQEKESFLAGKTASELGFTSQMLDALSKPEAIAGAILGLPPGTTTLAKEIGIPMYNAYIDFVNTYSDRGIANAALEADIAKTLSAPVGIAEQTAVEEKDVGDYSIDDRISIELPSLYDKYSIAAQQELDTAVPSQPPGIGPGPATPSGIPDMGITPATSSSELGAVHGISPDIEAAINDIANEIDTPTTSSPPSTMSDHANVHGDSPSPATPDMGTDFGDGYNSPDGDDNPGGNNSSGNNSGGATGGGTSMGSGSGMSGPGDMGGGDSSGGGDSGQGDAAGSDAGTYNRGGRIYASKGGPVYAHEGTNLLGETRLTSPTQNYDSFKASDEQIKGFFDSQEYKDFEEQQKTAINTMDMGSNSKYFSDYMGSSSKGAAQDRAFELYMRNLNQPIPTAGANNYGGGLGSMFNTGLDKGLPGLLRPSINAPADDPNTSQNEYLNFINTKKSDTMTPISGGK